MPWWSRRRSSIPKVSASVDDLRGMDAGGLRAEAVLDVQVASLRYFGRAGSFCGVVQETLGQPLPEPCRATVAAVAGRDAQIVLAWRSPTETLLLCKDRATVAELQARLAGAADGCMVDQTGGICVLRVQGRRCGDLLQRMGAATAIPGLGLARGGRLAEVHVLTACIQEGEFLLFVERVYADHLVEWMRATVADFS
jgi:heterotetrameric sarcosine oxidase gamma subunit